MAKADRPESFLPTIKCSSCSQEIEISQMGEHICSSSADSAADSLDVYSSNYSSLSSNVYDSKRYENTDGQGDQDRRVPPQVDTFAANRSYHRPGQLTPVSNSSGSQSVSPKTPVGPRGGRAGFEPTIAGDFDSPSQRRPGGYGGLGPVDEPDNFASSNGNGNSYNNINNNNSSSSSSSSSSNNYAPLASPMKLAGHSLLQRMNTIVPGPFDVSRRPSNALARQERAERDEEFEVPSIGRAGTFPRLINQINQPTENTEQPPRTPSAPGLRPERRRQPSNVSSHDANDGFYRSNTARIGPDTSRPPPPRTSLLRPRTAGRDGSGGSVPQINLAAEFGSSNPYHAPHDSMSSTVSSNVSSNVSSLSRPSIPFSSSQSSFSSAFSASFFSTSPSTNSLSQFDTASQPPPARKNSNNVDLDSLLSDLQSMKTTDRGMPSPQMQQLPLQNDRARVGGYGGSGSSNDYSRDDVDTSQGRTRTPAPARAPALAPAPAAAPPPSRGNCKACGDPITGKSVSSADGRLTGRYHKACFVCTTCTAPFTSAEFYVHSDMPYCERHYHEVNGSLCGTCNNGIEGQYLADESDCKHHRTCFVCADCSQPLEDGYFEVAGKVYCERDAWRRVQQSQPPPPQQQQQYQYQYQQPMRNMNNMNNMGRNNYGMGPKGNLGVPRGNPSGPGMPRRPSNGNVPMSMGMSSGMGNGPLAPPRMYGPPGGNRLGPGPRPRMEKRMTRLGMM